MLSALIRGMQGGVNGSNALEIGEEGSARATRSEKRNTNQQASLHIVLEHAIRAKL